MNRAAKASLLLCLAVAWLMGGDVAWGPYIVGGGGLICLVLAIRAFRAEGGTFRECWSWRIFPWLLWIALVGISIWNPSHRPQYPELGRQHAQTAMTGDFDTTGNANPMVPVDHLEALPASSDAGRSALYLMVTVGIMALGVALALCPMRRKEIRQWLTIVFVNGLVLTLAGLFFHFKAEGLLLGFVKATQMSPYATFQYKNLWTAYGVLCAAVGVALAFRSWRAGHSLKAAKSPTAFYAFATPFILLSFLVTEARAGLLLTFLLAAWWLVVMMKYWLGSRSRGSGSWQLPVLASLVLMVLGWFGWQTLGAQIEDMIAKSENQLEQVDEGEPTERMMLIEDTWVMAKEKPWFGWGLATFAQVYLRYQNDRLWRRTNFPGGEDFMWVPRYFQFAHCDWLQYAAETGFVGLILLLATPIAWCVHGWRKGRSNPLTHWLYVGALLILFVAIFEFPFASEAVGLLFAACVALGGKYALLEAKARGRKRGRGRSRSRQGSDESPSGGAEGEGASV